MHRAQLSSAGCSLLSSLETLLCAALHMHREGMGLLGRHPWSRDFALRDPTCDLRKTLNLAGPLHLQGQDTDTYLRGAAKG